MADPGSSAMLQLLAGMQAVEQLRAQNAQTAQTLAAQMQLQRLGTPANSHSLASQQQLPPAALHPVTPAVASAPPRRPKDKEAVEKIDEPEVEVPRCHLHRKQNKACKFCKAFFEAQELRSKRLEEKKNAAIEKLREGASANSGKGLGENDKTPLPNFPLFHKGMLERIQKNEFYNSAVANGSLADVNAILKTAETCDVEARARKSLDLEPSQFICCVYRLLTLQLTEGQLRGMLASRSCWIRCAGMVYVRLGMHFDRYWDLLSNSLLDDEEFVPFPNRGNETMIVGQFVEQLLTKDKYGDFPLQRIPVAQRTMINKRMVLYSQYRKRYQANLEVLERFDEPGVEVEVCSPDDGEWSAGETAEPPSSGQHCKTILVRFPDGSERNVSLGMIICPGSTFTPEDAADLTRTRGRSAQELLGRFEEQQKGAALASGKDYCKTSGQHTIRVGGIPFVAGVKRKELEQERSNDDEADRIEVQRRSAASVEQQAKRAAIEQKYLAKVVTDRGKSAETEGPERMRLG